MKVVLYISILIGTCMLIQAYEASPHLKPTKIVKKQYVNYENGGGLADDGLGDGNQNFAMGGDYGVGGGGSESSLFNGGGLGSLGDINYEKEDNTLSEDSTGASRHLLENPDTGDRGGNELSQLSALLSQDQESSNGDDRQGVGFALGSQDSTSTNPTSNSLGGFSDSLNSDDILSSFSDDSYGKKLESNVNLEDTASPGLGSQSDLSSFVDNFKGNSQIDKLLTSGYSLGLPSDNGATNQNKDAAGQNKHDKGETKEGIGSKFEDVQDLLSSELSQLDSADEKLEKMLESGINSDSGFTDSSTQNDDIMMNGQSAGMNMGMGMVGTATGGGVGVGTAGPQSAQSQWGGTDSLFNNMQQTQMTNQYPDSQSMASLNDGLVQQQDATNQQATLSQETPLPKVHAVNHAHASDKHGATKMAGNDHLSLQASKNALQKQLLHQQSHKERVVKLKGRLKLLQEKIVQLEDEQSKKSTSSDGSDPRGSRNNAIKRLLIKNLKLAAMIATKEIQLEEAKARTLSNASERKDLKTMEPDEEDKKNDNSNHDFMNNSKPLTELSRKAEEEVNHLTKTNNDNEQASLKTNITLHKELNKSKYKTKIAELTSNNNKTSSTERKNDTVPSNNVVKINETLEILDRSSHQNNLRNITSSSKRNSTTVDSSSTAAITSSKTKTNSTSSGDNIVQVVDDKGMASLFTAMKEKAATTARRRSTLHKSAKKLLQKKHVIVTAADWD